MPILLGAAAAPTREPRLADLQRNFHDGKEALLFERFEREYLELLLEKHGENLSEAARVAGVERKYLYRLMAKRGVTPRGADADDDA